jgi:hypothetical protein
VATTRRDEANTTGAAKGESCVFDAAELSEPTSCASGSHSDESGEASGVADNALSAIRY